MVEEDEDVVECPYCGEEFDSEHEKGVHISEEHVEDGNIGRTSRAQDRTKHIIRDWNSDD